MIRWLRNRRRPPPPASGAPGGDPEGVARAERTRRDAERRLAHDRAHVINPLREEAYCNNIQAMVERLLRPGGGDRGARAH